MLVRRQVESSWKADGAYPTGDSSELGRLFRCGIQSSSATVGMLVRKLFVEKSFMLTALAVD